MIRRLAVFAGYWALFLFLFRDVAFGGLTFIAPDIHPFYYPVWHFVSGLVKDGVLPLWNPYMDFGVPLLGNVQACAFYPLTMFFYGPDFLAGFNHYVLFHLAMASFFTYLFARACGTSESGALISGLCFGLSGYLLAAIHLTIALCAVSYFPLVLLLFGRSLEDRRFVWKAAAAGALLMQYLAGDPTVCLVTSLVLFLWAVDRSAAAFVSRRGAPAYPFTALATIFWCFLGLSAFQSLLFAEFVLHSSRLGQQLAAATQWRVEPAQLWGLALPSWIDTDNFLAKNGTAHHWLENIYAGGSTLVLAGLCVVSKKTVQEKKLLWLALLGTALAMGSHSFVYNFLYHFTWIFRVVRFPARFFFLVNFSVACLAGFGFDRLMRGAPLADPRRKAAVAAAVIAALAVLFFPGPVQASVFSFLKAAYRLAPAESSAAALSVSLALRHAVFYGLGTLAAVLAGTRFKSAKVWACACLLVWITLDLFGANAGEPAFPRALVQAVPKNAAKVLEDPDLFRVMTSNDAVNTFYRGGRPSLPQEIRVRAEMFFPNLPLLQRIHFFWGYDSLFLRDIFEVKTEIASRDLRDNPWLDLVNVKYLSSFSASLPGDFERLREDPAGNLFLNRSAGPRAFLVPDAAVKRIKTGIDFEPRPDFKEVAVAEYAPNRVRMTADADAAGWLFFSDTYYPGWKALLDGKPVPITRAHRAFRAIAIPAGQHEVVWSYDPPLFKWGSMLSLLTLACILFRLRQQPLYIT